RLAGEPPPPDCRWSGSEPHARLRCTPDACFPSADRDSHSRDQSLRLVRLPSMNYHGLVKSLDLPAGWVPPTDLAYDDVRARAISRADLDDDVRGINASIDLIQRTRGGDWPAGPVSADFNYVDLVWHELEFRERYSFTYAVYDSHAQYLGCCYL